MSWNKVGAWLRDHAGAGASLIGSLLVGNVPGAVAAGVAMVTSVTGEATPERALEVLQNDPTTLLKLRELAVKEADSIRAHIRDIAELEAKDAQEAHKEQQATIRSGDNVEDPYVRHTRPRMARQSWSITALYVIAFEGFKVAGLTQMGASIEFAALLGAPAAAYLGFRTLDKRFSSGAPASPAPVVKTIVERLRGK